MQIKTKSFKIEHRKLVLAKDKENDESIGPKNIRIISQNNSHIFRRTSSIQSKQRPSKTKEKMSKCKQKGERLSIFPNFRESTENFSDQQLNSKSSSGKLFQSFEKMDKQIHLIGRNAQLDVLMKQLLSILKEKLGIFQCQVNSFTIQKDFFVHMLQYLICMLSSVETLDCNRLFHSMSELKNVFQLIHQYSFSHRKKYYQNRIKIHENIFSFSYDHHNYEVQINSKRKLIQLYNDECNLLLQNISKFSKQADQKKSFSLHLTKQLNKRQNDLQQFLLKISLLQQQQNKIKNRTEDIKQKYEEYFEKVKKLESYGSQQRQIIRLASQQYKSIQGDIYEFAVYLQSNQLASRIDFQPHPYTQMERVLIGEFEELVHMGTVNARCDEQTKRFKDLYEKTVSFFNKKDCDMQELLNFRAKCVREFIMQMKKWLRNWQLKQEYLVNLRNQFVLKNEVVKNLIDCIQSVSKMYGEQQLMVLIAKIRGEYSNIEENYKLGNSFY